MLDAVSLLRTAVLAVGVWLLAVWVVGAGYIVVTYIEAIRHVPKRSLAATLRSGLQEAFYVGWTQPLLPVFQVALKRMGSGGGETPIVLVHGYFQNRADFLYLANRLKAAGCGPLYAANFFWPQSLEASAVYVGTFVEGVRRDTGARRVDFLTHSSGGLLAMDVLAAHPDWIRRTVVIAIPWRGVTWRGPVLGRSGSQLRADSLYTRSRPAEIHGGPVLSIYSAHDNLVHPPETSRLVGPHVSILEVENLGHLAVCFDRRVGDAVVDFLVVPEANQEGDSSPSPQV